MKKNLFILCAGYLLLVSCEDKPDPYLISANSIGMLNKEVRISELQSIFEGDSIVNQVSEGEFFKSSNEIEIFDPSGTKKLLLEPVQAFDSTSTIGFIQVLDPRFQTAKGFGPGSTFKDIVENYKISRIENTLSAAVIFIDDMNIYVTVDKKELPAELRYDTQAKIQASQIPNDARIKYFMVDWD